MRAAVPGGDWQDDSPVVHIPTGQGTSGTLLNLRTGSTKVAVERRGYAPVTTDLESTATLLAKIRGGDDEARERMCAIYLPILTKWAHGRLPPYARDLAETDDLVQFSMLKALRHVENFDPRHEGAFLAYLRKILLNKIRREIGRISKQQRVDVDTDMEDEHVSTVEQAIGGELFEQYEAALAKLNSERKEAVIMRVEFGFSFAEVATAMGLPSANAARMKVSRALLNLAKNMQ